MDLSSVSSITVQPGAIGLTAFSFSNIILEASAGSTAYTIPNGGALLQRFSVADPTGKSSAKPGDIWAKRYISTRSTDCTLSASDASGSGSLTLRSHSSQPFVTMCYLMWLTVVQPGDWTTLSGTYQIFGDQPVLVTKIVVDDMKDGWTSVG